MKKKSSTIILILLLVAGLSLLLYPTVSNWYNSYHSTQSVVNYTNIVNELDENIYQQYLDDARAYNERLLTNTNRYYMTEDELREYNSLLNVTGDGMMGYIEIKKLNLSTPVYHGTAEAVLVDSIGHIEGTSLPVGGQGTHCVVSGHRGLPSARLFTDLDMMVEGDVFVLHVLNEAFTYQVDQISIVEPQEIDNLKIEPDKDYCTLVTCTPYGVNSHRLLVRGHRIENAKDAMLTSDAIQIEPNIIAIIIAIPILLVLLVILFIRTGKKSNKKRGEGINEKQNS